MSTTQHAHTESEVWPERFGLNAMAPHAASNDTASAKPSAHEYQPQLGTRELIAEVRLLLATERRAGRLICRYLADLADRVRQRQDPALDAYADELHAARCFFGLGVRDTRERVRVGRALRDLPHVERALIEGDLSFSRVREITRVATAQTEHEWLELAQSLDMRSLERRVAMAGQSSVENDRDGRGQRRLDAPAGAEWTSPKTLRVTFELSTEAWALLERAMAGARRESEASLSDGEALEAVARDALLVQTRDIEASDPRRAVVLYECQRCTHTEVDTGAGAIELDPPSAAALGCGAAVHDLEREGRGVSRGGPLPAAVRRAVLLRDHCRCRVPGCNRRRYVDVHHLTERAHGGKHSRRNCLVLCTTHHRLLHEGKLRVEGDADRELRFYNATGEELGVSLRPLRSRHEHGGSADGTEAAARSCLETIGHASKSQGGSSEAADGANGDQGPPTTQADASNGPPGHSSSKHAALSRAAASFGLPLEPAARLLQIMGRRGGWSADALIEASGLSASQVAVALTLLELAGCARWRDFALEPI